MKKGFIEPVVHQAFSHMSRMHTSSSAAFFASSFAYLAYLGYYVLNIRQHVLGWDRHVTLLGLPFLAPLFLMARYFSVNIALKGVAEDIRICDHVPNEDSQCDHPTLHQYLSGKYPKLWLAVTQTDSFAYWAILLFALLAVIWFVWIFWEIRLPVK